MNNTLEKAKRVDREKIVKRIRGAYKSGYQSLVLRRSARQRLLFILGCQRSGTTLMTELFERDFRVKVYGEYSKLSSRDPNGLRLNPLPEVAQTLAQDRAPLIVMKPLVETQNALALLAQFPHAKILWMYRDYRDVARSKLKKSGMRNGIRDMLYIVEQRPHWRAENVSEEVRGLVRKHYSPSMNPYDGAALYWYVRNSFLFEQNLAQHPAVYICRYESFVEDPVRHLREIYDFVDLPAPDLTIPEVHASSVGKGAQVELSAAVAALCDEMTARLDSVWTRQNEGKAI